ncbi:Uncharacterised protein [Candidatus Burarchaeum australiense]|nr:Uncharacterised protein [Candidatus Burarchaeum australiense]
MAENEPAEGTGKGAAAPARAKTIITYVFGAAVLALGSWGWASYFTPMFRNGDAPEAAKMAAFEEEYAVQAAGTPQQRLLNVAESLTAQHNEAFNGMCESEARKTYLLKLQEDVPVEGADYRLCSAVSAGQKGEVLFEQQPMSKMQGAEKYTWIQTGNAYISTETASLRVGFYDIVGIAGDKLIVGHSIMVPQDGMHSEPTLNLTVNIFANSDAELLGRLSGDMPLPHVWDLMQGYLGNAASCTSVAREDISEVRLQPDAGENGETFLHIRQKSKPDALGDACGQTILVFSRNQLELAERVRAMVQDFANARNADSAQRVGKGAGLENTDRKNWRLAFNQPAKNAARLGGQQVRGIMRRNC